MIIAALSHRDAHASSTWTTMLVRERLIEAFTTERRMPGQGSGRLASAWPASATPVHDFEDVLGWEDARERVWENWSRAKGAYSFEVTRMEEAIDWLRMLPDKERRCLASWAALTAYGRSVRAMLDKRRLSRTSFYRSVERAAHLIALRLNAEGVAVR